MFKEGDLVVGNDKMYGPSNRGRLATLSYVSPNGEVVNVVWDDGQTGKGISACKFDTPPTAVPELATDVEGIGKEIIATLTERGKQYDASGKEAERSMKKIVTAFNAITGKELTAVEGWAFMQVLKQVRFFSNTGTPHRDSLIDNGAYALLQAEEALQCPTK